MKRTCRCLAAALTLCMLSGAALASGSAAPGERQGTVVEGNARFQFLSPSLVRMEYASGGRFVDAPTAVVLRRDWPPVDVNVTRDGDWVIARTRELQLRYRPGSAGFTPANLRVSWNDGAAERNWSPGDTDHQNLGGISHSLDGARKGRFPAADPGLLSRSGYCVLDDSQTPVWDSAAQWITPRADTARRDWYLMAYGKNYARALQEYALLCGSIPLVPRYVLGGWITDLNYEYLPGHEMVDRYTYSDSDIRAMVERFQKEQIPLDVLVLDFAWHRYGWQGGYDWSPVFPDPAGFLAWAHQQGLKVTVNDHPGYGGESTLSDSDSHAPQIRKLLGLVPPRPPSLTIDISRGWKFHLDTSNVGLDLKWFDVSTSDGDWTTLEAGRTWEDQGFPEYDGIAWYRKWVDVPATLPAGPIYLAFGGVDDEYDLFLNGMKIAHHGSPGSSVYSTMTATDVSSTVQRGTKNLVVLRVNDWGGGGGMTKLPAMLTDVLPAGGIRFNLAEKQQAEAFMNILHDPVVDQGVDFWWIDGGSGSCQMDGLNSQMWTNRVFFESTQDHTGKRGFVFSRYGGWGDHRSPGFFTGDTHSEWEVLAYEVPFTARGGNVLVPFITHDIGGFLGKRIDFSLYARWLEFGVFSPILRLHSAFENPRDGNLRLPWMYGEKGTRLAKEMFQLRYRLIPYIYTYCRIAHDDALPIVRPLYLEHPDLPDAYEHPDEYYFGSELLVAPVVTEGEQRRVYLPPGQWTDFSSGEKHNGGTTITVRAPVHHIPVFVRSGSIIPMGKSQRQAGNPASDSLSIEIYGPGEGRFRLYEDDGISLDYRSGKYAWTPMRCGPEGSKGFRCTIGPTTGTYTGQISTRSWTMTLHGLDRPRSVSVATNSRPLNGSHWSWDKETHSIVITTPSQDIRTAIDVVVR